MNILNLLTKEKRVAGVEISDRVIRIAYFRPRKKRLHLNELEFPEHELILIEEPIGANIIKEGVVFDKVLLGKTLKDIWSRSKLSANYAIVSIPEDKVYSHIFSFPKTVNETHLVEAINLAIDFQLPLKKTDVYLGWENAGDSHTVNDVLISAIPKKIADGYIDALNSAGIKMLALESHIASIARSIKLKLGQATLFIKKSPDGSTIFILKDSMLRFSRTLPGNFINESALVTSEAERVKTSFESDKRIPVVEMPLTSSTIRDEYLEYPELNKDNPETQAKWLIALGAAIRGELPKGSDNHISLLPVGTAEAYAYQQTTTFIELIRNIMIGVSIFFLLTFFASYLLIFSLYQTANKSSNLSVSPVSPEMSQKQDWINKINLLTSASMSILSSTPSWDILLNEINSHVIDGIIISSFNSTSIGDQMSIVGTARDRSVLNEFKKSLQDSTYLTSVELPIANLEQKTDIPFSISFRLKDPSMLYYK